MLTPRLALLFTGHRVDAANRDPKKRRFPPTPEAEAKARRLIYDAVHKQVGADATNSVGISGGASGGDILFHEVCAELGIRTELLLALPVAEFEKFSVADGGERWVARFKALCARVPPRIMPPSKESPMEGRFWEENNLWLLSSTLALQADRQVLIALYNQELDPDGGGGTGHLVEKAGERGVEVVRVDARSLLK